jgi:hypothetical protein
MDTCEEKTNEKCSICTSYLYLLPSELHLRKRNQKWHLMINLDRSIPRCKHCDYVSTDKEAMDAELSGPGHTNPVKTIEEYIRKASQIALQGTQVQEMDEAIVRMREKLREVRKEQTEAVKKVWAWYFGIWEEEGN